MKIEYMGITRALALSGVTNFDFADEESKWRGSEVHKLTEFYDLRKLYEQTVPDELRGYLNAHKKFMAETGFIPQEIELKVQNKSLRIRGRVDRIGLMRGKRTIVDLKTGFLNDAVALQLCLGGFLADPTIWFQRCAVRLKADGTYSLKNFPLIEWPVDVATALACVRVARWRVDHNLL